MNAALLLLAVLQGPADSLIPAGPMGEAIRHGRALLLSTRDSLPTHVGNSLRCTSCHLDEGRQGRLGVDDGDFFDPGCDGPDPDGLVEVKPVGQPRRGDRHLLFGLPDLVHDQAELGRGTLGVGLTPLLCLGVSAGEPGDFRFLRGRLAPDPEVGIRGQQLEVSLRDLQEAR